MDSADYKMLSSTVMALLAVYDLSSPYLPSSKQRAWLLTIVSSFIMTCVSTVFLYDFLVLGKGSVAGVEKHEALGWAAGRFFQGYLTTDLLLGFFSYPDQVNLLSGWIHHPIYILIVEFALAKHWMHIFGLCCIMELPTFIMGIGKVFPSLKSTIAFAVSFALTRVLFHVAMAVSYAIPANRPDSSIIPSAILGFLLCLHSFWFYQCLRGFWKRASSSSHNSTRIPNHEHPHQPQYRPSSAATSSSFQNREREQERLDPRQPTYRLITRSNLWRRRRIHRRMMYERAQRYIPNDFGARIFHLIPEREAFYRVVGLGRNRRPRNEN